MSNASFFYIPETQEEIKELVDQIRERQDKSAKLDFIYAQVLAQAFYEKQAQEEEA